VNYTIQNQCKPPSKTLLAQIFLVSRFNKQRQSNFKFEEHGEFEIKIGNILGDLSEAQMGLTDDKTRGKKSRDTVL
jgi:hypothetical protein